MRRSPEAQAAESLEALADDEDEAEDEAAEDDDEEDEDPDEAVLLDAAESDFALSDLGAEESEAATDEEEPLRESVR